MKTYFDCISCFYRQAISAARIANLTEDTQKQILIELSQNMDKFLSGYIPPEIARMVYDIVHKHATTEDIYKKIKEESNVFALKLYPELKERLIEADHSLLFATQLAIAGNIIDFAAKAHLDVACEIDRILKKTSDLLWTDGNASIFNFASFKTKIYNSKVILYLADNAGEIVFDKILLETIKHHNSGAKIYFAVKEKPIINDALAQDAIQCGIDEIATVISSGSELSGTILSYCNKEFLDLFNTADLVISKGQGNFEGLSQVTSRDIYFLFIAKCPVIARMINSNTGNMILYHKKQYN